MAMSPRTAALHGVAPLPRLRLPSLTSCGSRRVNVRAKVEPSEKSVEIMRKFSEQYARKSETYFCIDKGVTSVVIKGLADHKDMLGAPLCPCRHYDDKAAEVAQGFWNCPCVPMRERFKILPVLVLAGGRICMVPVCLLYQYLAQIYCLDQRERERRKTVAEMMTVIA